MYGEVGTLMLGHRRRWSVSVIGGMSLTIIAGSSVGRRSHVLLHIVAGLRRHVAGLLLRTIVGNMAEMGGDMIASTIAGIRHRRGTHVTGSIRVTVRRRAARRRDVIGRRYLPHTLVEQDTIRAMLGRDHASTASGVRRKKTC